MAHGTLLICLLLLTGYLSLVCGTLTVSYSPGYSKESEWVTVTAGEYLIVNMTISGIKSDTQIELKSQHPDFFVVGGNATFQLMPTVVGIEDPDLMANHSLSFVLQGIFIGIGNLTFEVTNIASNVDLPKNTINPLRVKVLQKPSILSSIFTYTLVVFLFVAYISMGVNMKWREVWKRLRRPWGVIIGAVSQFIVMPLVAYAVAKIANLDNESAVGLIVIASCPGGYVSNVITLLMECDLVLSITMTAVSSFIAFGLMPLNIYLYGREFTTGNESLKTPFENLVISLILLVIPILIGIFCYYKLPKVTKILQIVLRPISLLLIIISLGFGIPVFIYAFQAPPEVYLACIVLPLIGSAFGVLLAKMACLDNLSAITVAIETGYQNALVGLALSQLSYPQPEADLIARGPCLYYLFSMIEGTAIVGIYRLMKRFPGKPFANPDSQSEEMLPQNDTNGDAPPADVGLTNLTSPSKAEQAAAEEANSKF
ncbi:ileal sodium/bile acid cotransporter-like [Amphiura filiformis]|uniref:ileal sodium/bile acid cotransporter-like n=1 Tax=Amphiura filiformis TaxID=82378 RepID=UPI003B210216